MQPQSTLLLMVTCSRDESRRKLAIEVTKNIADLAPIAGLERRVILFDNASTFDDHIHFAPAGTTLCRADRNIGYWTAIKWVLDNRARLGGEHCDYLYIIESDLWHLDLTALTYCEEFLERNKDAVGVRTQEFSVRWRWRYNKGLRFVPFRKQRSVVHLVNQGNGEKAWFRKTTSDRVYLSNLHAKLPALNRLSDLDAVFPQLAELDGFTEADFFRLMGKRRPYVGVLDGGLWYQLSTPQTKDIVSGSWSDQVAMDRLGYQGTRTASIDRASFNVSISVVGVQRIERAPFHVSVYEQV